jgi:CysZ protein
MWINKKGNNPLVAVSCLLKGMKLLAHPRLRQFLIIPVIINMLLYSLFLFLGYHYVGELIDQFIPSWLQWLSWVLWPLFFISFFIVGFFTFTVLANMLSAPFYGKLAASTLAIVEGQSINSIEQPVARVVSAELKRAGYFASRALPLLIVSIIPGLNFLAPFLWGFFGAWGVALEYLAYPLENEGVLFSEQRQLVKGAKVGALSFGALVALGLTLPLVNIIVAPAAVIAATLYVRELKQE